MSDTAVRLDVEIEDTDDERVARLEGMVDVFTAGGVVRRVLANLPRDATRVVIDLRGVRFMDSAGLSAVVRLSERARRRALDLRAELGESSRLNPTVAGMLRRVVTCDEDRQARPAAS
jgi:anti-anti-sigma factor